MLKNCYTNLHIELRSPLLNFSRRGSQLHENFILKKFETLANSAQQINILQHRRPSHYLQIKLNMKTAKCINAIMFESERCVFVCKFQKQSHNYTIVFLARIIIIVLMFLWVTIEVDISRCTRDIHVTVIGKLRFEL